MLRNDLFVLGFIGGNTPQQSKAFKHPAEKEPIDHHLQVYVTGDSSAGKTTLIQRMCDKNTERHKWTLDHGYNTCDIQLNNETTYLRVNDLDTKEYDRYKDDHTWREKNPIDASVAFIVIKLRKKRDQKELELFIQNKSQEIRNKISPHCKIVLVATQSDKAKFKTTPEMLKAVAQKLQCIGVALINDALFDVQRLFQATVEHVVAEKKARLAPAASAMTASAPIASQPSVTKSPSTFFAQQPAAAPELLLSAEQQIAIQDIREYINELKQEICSCFTWNRRRKLLKIDAMKDLISLIRQSPATPINEHIAAVKREYRDTDMEVGTRTPELFAKLIRDVQTSRLAPV